MRRTSVLRTGRKGEPDQRTAIVSIREPNRHLGDALESTPVVVFVDGLRVDQRLSGVCFTGYRNATGAMRNDPGEVVEDRGASEAEREARGPLLGQRISVPGTLCGGLSKYSRQTVPQTD